MVPYGEVHSTPEVMADISATPSSEKMTNLITDYSGDPVTLDDNLGLRPRARAVSGLRPCARAIFGSAPPIIQLALSIATSIFVVTVDFVHYFLTAARRLVVCARERFTAACALSAACVARPAPRLASPSAPESTAFSPSCSPSPSPSLFLDQHQCQSPQSSFQS